MTLRDVEYVDVDGRRWRRRIPVDAPDSEAAIGIPVGPPPLGDLGLPLEIEVRLHNQLYDRRIFTERDARRHIQDISSAVMTAFRVDVNRILEVYQGQGVENADRSTA